MLEVGGQLVVFLVIVSERQVLLIPPPRTRAGI
jgi:hypothetical protein